MYRMKPTIISIKKIDNLKYRDHQLYPGIYTSCPDCNGDIVYGMTSCPDGREGCCVAHYGFGCLSCKTVYDVKYELPDDGMPKEPFRVFEEIGIGIINTRGLKRLDINKEIK